jgi:hypothetical protein
VVDLEVEVFGCLVGSTGRWFNGGWLVTDNSIGLRMYLLFGVSCNIGEADNRKKQN